MLKLLKPGIELVIFALILVSPSHLASAYWPYSHYQAYSSWYGCGSSYSNYSQESVPYFALNPPVYYSYSVARTYGLYPFPYFADSTQNPSVTVEPKLVRNNFVEQQPRVESESIGPQPLRISNSFVDQAGESNPVKKASWEKPKSVKPKVIYPSKLASAN